MGTGLQSAWKMWQASRASIEIDLLERYDICEMSRNPFDSYRCIEVDPDGDYVKFQDVTTALVIAGMTMKSANDIANGTGTE